jgi:hypothetical protein
MYFSQKVVDHSVILTDMNSEFRNQPPCPLSQHDTCLLNYVAELSEERLDLFIKAINNDYLIKLFNLCDYLDIQDLMSIIGKELGTRMNNMSKESLRIIASNSSFKGIM